MALDGELLMNNERYLRCVKSLSFFTAIIISGPAMSAEKFSVAEDQIQALGIKVSPVQSMKQTVSSRYPGQVVVPPKAEQVVSSPLEGVVVQLLVGEYQPVRKGDPVARLSSPAMSQLQLQLLQAASRATLARQAYSREQTLFDEGLIPKRRAQEAQATLKEAEATLVQTKAELALAGLTPAMMEQVVRSGIPSDRIILTAVQDGIVSAISVRPGQRVDGATSLLNITQVDALWLDVQVPSQASIGIQPGAPVTIVDKNVSGRVINLSPTVTADNQFVVLRAEIENPGRALRPGELVTVEIPVQSTGNSWDIPISAVARNKADSVVFVRTPEGFEARPVKVEASAGQLVRVQGNIREQDQVAVAGVIALKGAWLEEDGE